MAVERQQKAIDFLKTVVAPRDGGLESTAHRVQDLQPEDLLPGAAAGDEQESLLSDAGIEEAAAPRRRVGGADRTVQRTVEKIIADEPLEPDEQFALEAIIIPDKRPAIDVIRGSFQVADPLWSHLGEGPVRKLIEDAIPSVGRVELPSNPLLPFAGTGFVVGDGLLMTNRHVAVIFAGGPGNLTFQPGARPAVDFLRERAEAGGDSGSLNLRVTSVVMIHPYWDMALLRVEGLPPAQKPLALSLENPDDLKGREVALLGYPAFDPRNAQAVQNQVFGGVYNVKRLMPGVINGRAPIKSFGKQVSSATHDASTLGGASGSVVLDLVSGAVLGLHFGGIYLKANYGVPACDLARDGRVIDAGVRFAGSPSREAGEWDEWWRRLAPVGGTSAVAPAGPAAPPGERATVQVTAAGDPVGRNSWTIPIMVTIDVGAPGAAAVAATESVAAAEHGDVFGDADELSA